MTLAGFDHRSPGTQAESATSTRPRAVPDASPPHSPAPNHIGWLERAIGLVAVTSAVAWAAWPLQPEGPPSPSLSRSLSTMDAAGISPNKPLVVTERPPLDYAAFHIPLWKTPTRPAATDEPVTLAPPTTPIAPIKLQLLAIIREAGIYAAMCYDPGTDALMVLHEGDSTGGRTVERITDEQLDLRDERGLVTLSIQDIAGGGGGGGGGGNGVGGGGT